MAPICSSLISPDFNVLSYADDNVLFSSDKSLDRSTKTLNDALKTLTSKLSTSLFSIAPEKSNFMIFTRKRITAYPHLVLDNQTVLPSTSVTYLGLKLDPKLRCILHFQYLKDIP